MKTRTSLQTLCTLKVRKSIINNFIPLNVKIQMKQMSFLKNTTKPQTTEMVT